MSPSDTNSMRVRGVLFHNIEEFVKRHQCGNERDFEPLEQISIPFADWTPAREDDAARWQSE
jgi:hypothetical protein